MKKILFLALAISLLLAMGSMLVANSQSATGSEAKGYPNVRRSSPLIPMRLIFGFGTRVGAMAYITVIGADGLAPPEELPFSFVNGAFSFDGEFIAFDNCGDRFDNPRGIYLANLADRTSRLIHPLTTRICVTVEWSPDGKRLSFPNPDDHRLQIINLETAEVSVTPNIEVGMLHSWSPEGDKIVFDRGRGGRRELFITNLEGQERQLTYLKDFGNCETWGPTWAPDGSRIAFSVSEPRRKLSLYTIAPDGTEIKKLETPDTAYSPQWSTDSEWIIYRSGDDLLRIRKDGTDIHHIGNLLRNEQNSGYPFSLGAQK
jgi:Tol biopolymer transport system component